MKHLFWSAAALALIACGGEQNAADSAPSSEAATEAPAEETAAPEQEVEQEEAALSAEERLDAVLAAQDDDAKARYQYRHPKETLMFYGIDPGMTVVDTLPGSVWYAGILSEYLGPEGRVIGANFSLDQRKAMGGRYASEEYQTENANWPETWAAERNADREDGEAPFDAFFYGALPAEMEGSADVVLMVRAAHHFNRTEEAGGFFTEAVQNAYDVLKPGGVLGVVQHRAPEGNSDEWAVGDNGYIKQSHVIDFVTDKGFEFVESSEINANPDDQPTEEDVVWRLPPSLGTTRDHETDEAQAEQRVQYQAIGESDRMTLKFRKPE